MVTIHVSLQLSEERYHELKEHAHGRGMTPEDLAQKLAADAVDDLVRSKASRAG